jgi:hypothetical protein
MRRFVKIAGIILFSAAIIVGIMIAWRFPTMASKTEELEFTSENGDFVFKWVIPPEFYRGTAGFSEGRIWVQRKEGGPWTLYDDRGNVIKDNFEHKIVSGYNSDITMFETKEGNYGLVDASGDITAPGTFFLIDLGFYSEGLIPAAIGNFGYINIKGEWVILPQFRNAFNFKNGFAQVKIDDKWGVINKKGEWVIPAEFESMYPFINGIACAKKNGKWGNIDKNGSTVLDFKFDQLANFVKEDGVTIAAIGDLYGLIDKSGNFVVEPQFISSITNLSLLSERTRLIGLVDKHGKVGYFDLNGNLAIDFKFIFDEEVWRRNLFYDFAGGIAAVLLDDPERTRALIDEKGNVVFRFPADARMLTRPIHGNYVVYVDKDRYMVCDKKGRIFDITPYLSPHFDGISKGFITGRDKIITVQTPKHGKVGYFTITPKEGD